MERSRIIRENARLSKEYMDLVEELIIVGLRDATHKDIGGVRCPCRDCRNNAVYEDVDVLREHLICRGFDQSYTEWVWHGEGVGSANVDIIDRDTEENMRYEEGLDEMVVDVVREFTGKPSLLAAMYADKETPLFCGSKHSIMAATLLLMNLKAKHGISDHGMSDILELVKDLLPPENLCPDRVYAAKKILCPMGMEFTKIHACPNDCMLYRGKDDLLLDRCRVCRAPRYKTKEGKLEVCGEGETVSSKESPCKVMWYLPIVPRLKRLFANPEDAKMLTWHHDRIREGGDIIAHASDGDQWKKMDHLYPEFANEPRHLRFGLSTDGMNPFGNMSSTHSSWPVMVVIYNLPSWLMMKRKYVLLSTMISGPKQPGNDIDVYLAPLVEDLKALFNEGVWTADGSRGDAEFKMKGMLLWSINDFPALGNLGGYSVKGHFACPICESKTSFCQLKHGRKPVFLGHRRFLPESHPWRRAKKLFNGTEEFGIAPIPLSGLEIFDKVSGMSNVLGKGKKKNTPQGIWKKCSIFFDLPYWKHLDVRHCLDVMHIEKNVCESLVGTLLNTPGKTKDGLNSRKDLVHLGIRPSLAPSVVDGKTYLPPACYTMSVEEKESFCNTLKSVRVPSSYSSNISSCVAADELKLVGMKSHDCHNLMQELNVIALRGCLPPHVNTTLSGLSCFFKEICRKKVSRARLDELQTFIVQVLCRMEMYFPPSFFDVMVHLIVHLVREIKLCGPVYLRWMYPFERYMSIFKHFVKNRYRPDASIVQRYVAEEVIEFCTKYLQDVPTVGVPSSRHEGRADGRGLRHKSKFSPSSDDLSCAHLYILRNHAAVSPYVDIHMNELKEQHPNWSAARILSQHCVDFTSWIKVHVGKDGDHPQEVKWLAKRPLGTVTSFGGYDINGYTFGTRWNDEKGTTQNSGVSVPGEGLMGRSNAYFGTITDIWEMDFVHLNIALFKCEWVEQSQGTRTENLGITLVNRSIQGSQEDPFIMAAQAHQVFYVKDPVDSRWEIVVDGKKAFTLEGFHEDIAFAPQDTPLLSLPELEMLTEDDIYVMSIVSRTDHDEGMWVNQAGQVSKRKRKLVKKKTAKKK